MESQRNKSSEWHGIDMTRARLRTCLDLKWTQKTAACDDYSMYIKHYIYIRKGVEKHSGISFQLHAAYKKFESRLLK